MFSKCVAALLLMTSLAATAQDDVNRLALKPEIQRGDISNPKGLWPLIGFGLGATDRGDTVRTGGFPMHIKVLGSYYFEQAPWIADLGLGFHNQVLTEDGRGAQAQDDSTIQAMYTEIAARYKFGNRWSAGPLWNTLVDNADRYRSNTDNLASFIGVQVLKEFTWQNNYLVRTGVRATTDVGISSTTVDTIMGEIQVSFGNSAPAEVAEAPAPPPPPVEPAPIAPHLAKRAVQVFTLDPGPVNFDTDSTRLISASDTYLKRLARALALNRELFDRVEVVGHADQRGTDQYNLKLSQRRANAISDKLVAAGVNRNQIKGVGRGRRELLSTSMNPTALLRNRRVELEFQGVKNREALKNVIDSVKE